MVTAEQPEAPPYFTYDAILNTKEHATLDQTLDQVLKPLSLAELLAKMASGAQVLDVRDPAEFLQGIWRAASTLAWAASSQAGQELCSIESGPFCWWLRLARRNRQPRVSVASVLTMSGDTWIWAWPPWSHTRSTSHEPRVLPPPHWLSRSPRRLLLCCWTCGQTGKKGQVHRGKPAHSFEPFAGTRWRTSCGPAIGGPLCRRLPFFDCGKYH